jgi:2-iminobutanoate/2-iminopropanoate deaminase
MSSTFIFGDHGKARDWSRAAGFGPRDSMLCQTLQQGRNMSKHVIQSEHGAPPQGAYSQGWRAGDFIFVTGTGPLDPVTGKLVGSDIEQQTGQTIDNISAILAAEGASLGDVVKVTVHLSDTSLFARYNAVYAKRFTKPYPVRTTVGSDLGHTPGMLIEIDCIAYLPQKQARPRSRSTGRGTKKKARRR